jgi:DNA-binding FadR family transcriptional regulator
MVVDTLTDLIVSGELADGELLPPENELCKSFGVSRNILREATKIMASKGLLEVRQGYGTQVCKPEASIPDEALSNYLKVHQISLIHLAETRTALEIESARLAAQRRTQKHLAIMEHALQVLQDPAQELDALVEADVDFHQAIVDATGNPIFRIITRTLLHHLNYSRRSTIGYFGITTVVFEEHRLLYEAIKKKNSLLAAQCARAQMDTNLKHVKEIVRNQSRNN